MSSTKFLIAILILFTSSCGCPDDDPYFITTTDIIFQTDAGQILFGNFGVYEYDELNMVSMEDNTPVELLFYASEERDRGLFNVAFDKEKAENNEVESYLIEYPDASMDTLSVLYNKYDLCNGVNYSLIEIKLNGIDIVADREGYYRITK